MMTASDSFETLAQTPGIWRRTARVIQRGVTLVRS